MFSAGRNQKVLLFLPLSFETKGAGLFFLLCSSTPGSITSLDNRSKFVWHQRVSQVQKKRNKNIIKMERETARRSKRTSKPNNQTTAYIAQYKGKRHSFFFLSPCFLCDANKLLPGKFISSQRHQSANYDIFVFWGTNIVDSGFFLQISVSLYLTISNGYIIRTYFMMYPFLFDLMLW